MDLVLSANFSLLVSLSLARLCDLGGQEGILRKGQVSDRPWFKSLLCHLPGGWKYVLSLFSGSQFSQHKMDKFYTIQYYLPHRMAEIFE